MGWLFLWIDLIWENGKMKKIVILAILFVVSYASADPTVPSGFVIQKIIDRIDGQTPRLEAIRNSEYGSGVVLASMDKGTLNVLKISQGSIELTSVMSGFLTSSRVATTRFDRTGIYNSKLFISVVSGTGANHYQTDLLKIESDGTITNVMTIGDPSDMLQLFFDFTNGSYGYTPGAYMEDHGKTNGTSLYHMNTAYSMTKLSQNHLPSGRTDLDIMGMQFDSTGRYNNYLTMADSDTNTDNWAVIYQLKPDLSWTELTSKVRTSVINYRDICFSNGGSFNEMLYATDRVSQAVWAVDPNGVHNSFASGFNEIESITVDETGEFMYISDFGGVWRITSSTTVTGPQIVMQEPKVASDGVFTDPSGGSSLRLLWNEPIIFNNTNVNITNANNVAVPFSVSGSNSPFMIIAFGNTLLNDKHTITINDSVVSADTGHSIDGDGDGIAGGDAIIVMEHRERHDSDNDNDIDLVDLSELAEKWLWQE